MASHVRSWRMLRLSNVRLDSTLKVIPSFTQIFPTLVRRCMSNKTPDDQSKTSSTVGTPQQDSEVTEINNSEVHESSVNRENPDASPSSFLSAFQKFSSDQFLNPAKPTTPDDSFATMFRNSKFVELGDPKGKVVIGKIYHTVGDDLYVDFGWKFPCVVQRPDTNPELFVRDAKVRLRINELELSTIFLGSSTEMSLNEADCTLIGFVSSPLGEVRGRVTHKSR